MGGGKLEICTENYLRSRVVLKVEASLVIKVNEGQTDRFESVRVSRNTVPECCPMIALDQN